jgi:hypothetical protein
LGGIEEVSLLEELASVGQSPFHERRSGRGQVGDCAAGQQRIETCS